MQGGKCHPNRDRSNNVCCKSAVKDECSSVVRGLCPAKFEVPRGCCRPRQMKYDGVLLVRKSGHVCCNSPCAEAANSSCPTPEHCKDAKPLARSYGHGTSVAGAYTIADMGFNTYMVGGRTVSSSMCS